MEREREREEKEEKKKKKEEGGEGEERKKHKRKGRQGEKKRKERKREGERKTCLRTPAAGEEAAGPSTGWTAGWRPKRCLRGSAKPSATGFPQNIPGGQRNRLHSLLK